MERNFELNHNTEITIFDDGSAIIKLVDTKYSVPLSRQTLDRLERVLKFR